MLIELLWNPTRFLFSAAEPRRISHKPLARCHVNPGLKPPASRRPNTLRLRVQQKPHRTASHTAFRHPAWPPWSLDSSISSAPAHYRKTTIPIFPALGCSPTCLAGLNTFSSTTNATEYALLAVLARGISRTSFSSGRLLIVPHIAA